MKKVFLDDLPRIKGKKNKINWRECIGKEVTFRYEDIEGIIKFNNYDNKKHVLNISYLNNEYNIPTCSIISGALGNIIGKFNFKFSVGEIVKTKIGEVQILEQLRNHKKHKMYKYKCLKCPNTNTILESDLIFGKGCNVCCPSPQKLLVGYNDIATTTPWMIEHMVDKNDAYKYTYGSGEIILFKCKNCGKEKLMKICDFYDRGITCSRCGDGKSYPNKFAFNLLEQLKINFIPEYKFHNFRFDFYFEFNNIKYDLEMDGTLGHGNNNNFSGQSAKETLKEDEERDNFIKQHNIEVIRIDSKKSNLQYIKNNILTSKLIELFDLNNIDWNEIDKFALSTRVKEVCDMWNSGIDNVTQIHNITKLSNTTIVTYLKRGTSIGWCTYDAKLELTKRTTRNNQKRLSKPLICIETGKIYNSTAECDRFSEIDFGVKLFQANISTCCRNEKPYKGFHFKYIDKEDYKTMLLELEQVQ